MSDRERGSSWGAALAAALSCGAVHGLLLAILAFMLLRVVPTFELMFSEFGAALPTPTIVVLDLSRAARGAWFLWVPLAMLVLVVNTALLALLAHRRRWLWALLVGIAQAGPLVVAPALCYVALYLPIFAMAEMLE